MEWNAWNLRKLSKNALKRKTIDLPEMVQKVKLDLFSS